MNRNIMPKFLNKIKNTISEYFKHKFLNHALIQATRDCNLAQVKYLIENGADIHAENNEALKYSVYNGHSDIVHYLIIDCQMEGKDTTLKYLMERQLFEAIQLIKINKIHNKLELNLNNNITIDNTVKRKI
jgi:ankyrin repeat protein